MATWNDVLTQRDKELFAKSGYGKRANFSVSVVEECVFDRGQASHKINLFDMNMKYADVVSLKEMLDYIAGLPETLYAPGL